MSALSFLKKQEPKPTAAGQDRQVPFPGVARSRAPKLRGKAARNPLVRPHLTEKSGRLAEAGVYVFIVDRRATKPAVRRAVEERYRVSVAGVRMAAIPASTSRRGGRVVRKRRALKKAIVTLTKGQKIEEISA